MYYLHFCISLYTCANVICIKLLLTYLFFSLPRVTYPKSHDFCSRHLQHFRLYGPLYLDLSGVSRSLHRHLRPFTANGFFYPVMEPFTPVPSSRGVRAPALYGCVVITQRSRGVRENTVNVRRVTDVFVTRGSVTATTTAAISPTKTAPCAVSLTSLCCY